MKTIELDIPVDRTHSVQADLSVPENARSLVIFSHGSGSSRFSSRNKAVAEALNKKNMATLLADLLTPEEDNVYENRFNIDLLTKRLIAVTEYTRRLRSTENLPAGYFGASTGAASALRAAVALEDHIRAVVSRGGRADLASDVLEKLTAPTLLIVGSLDTEIIDLNERAYKKLSCLKSIEIIKEATHLFEEPGKLEEVAELASGWFSKHLLPHSALV
ncbi:MAG: dienelactone hydrolase family protein [Bacteroidia bacterium]